MPGGSVITATINWWPVAGIIRFIGNPLLDVILSSSGGRTNPARRILCADEHRWRWRRSIGRARDPSQNVDCPQVAALMCLTCFHLSACQLLHLPYLCGRLSFCPLHNYIVVFLLGTGLFGRVLFAELSGYNVFHGSGLCYCLLCATTTTTTTAGTWIHKRISTILSHLPILRQRAHGVLLQWSRVLILRAQKNSRQRDTKPSNEGIKEMTAALGQVPGLEKIRWQVKGV